MLAKVPKLKFGCSGLKPTPLSLTVGVLTALCYCLLDYEGFGHSLVNGG